MLVGTLDGCLIRTVMGEKMECRVVNEDNKLNKLITAFLLLCRYNFREVAKSFEMSFMLRLTSLKQSYLC